MKDKMMNKNKFSAFALSIIFMCSLFTSCNKNANQIKRMQQMEEGVENPTTVEEISSAIEEYGERIEDIIQSTQQTGVFWKLLGTRYLDNQQYGLALNAFQKAVEVYPANQNLYYYIGVCAGYLAKSALDYSATGDVSERQRYLELSEASYLRALEIEPRYVRALYGLSVLYVFDMDKVEQAEPYLESVLSIEPKHMEAMFVLARVYYFEGQYQKAVDLYDKIIATTTDKTYKADAEQNKLMALNALYDNV